MTKSKEWLILNAVKCWLHYCANTTEYTEEYYKLRDEYLALVEPKDASELTPKPQQRRANAKPKASQ